MNRFCFGHFPSVVLATVVLSSPGILEAADVDAYAIRKGALYSQTSAAAPTLLPSNPYLFRAVVEGDIFEAISEASVRLPLGSTLTLQLNDSFSALHTEIPAPSLSGLNTIAPDGTYTFLIDSENDGFSVVGLDVESSSLPSVIPQISNFAATQSVDATADFTLTFNTFGNVAGTEVWEFELLDSGFAIFQESGSGASVTIPNFFLSTDTTYEGRLRFKREITRDETSYPGALGTVEVYNETRFAFITGTGGGGGGGDDTTAPTLFFSTPASGAEDVPTSSQITFIFSEPMAPMQSIEWSANLNPLGFNYTWMNDGLILIATYPSGLPADSTITWKLNPTAGSATNFRDLAGNLLPVNQIQGSFSTAAAGDPNDPCNPNGGNDGRGAGSIFKSVSFVQTGNNAPVPDAEIAASFSAFYRAGTNQNVSSVSISGPAGVENLTSLFGNFFLNEAFTSGASLETEFPAGNYTITVAGTGGGNATLPLGSTAAIPVPRVSNLTELTNMDVTKDFTLNFAAFTGAGVNDGIFVEISGDEGQGEFRAPDPCVPRELLNTATSVVIPANTFKAGQEYRGSISFSRAGQDSSSIPNTTIVAGLSARTSFEFTIGGVVTPQPPTWSSIVRNQDGTLTYTIQGEIGLSLSIEGSNIATGGWSELSTAVLTSGSHQLTIDPALSPMRFIRARVL